MKQMTSTTAPRLYMTVRETVEHILSESKESLSSAEIRVRYTARTGRRIDVTSTNVALTKLVKLGKAFVRTETAKERIARAGGEASGEIVKGRPARLYSTQNPVPKRTAPLKDIVLGDGQASAFKSQKSPNTSAKVIDDVANLVKRVAQLEAQLAEARRVISK